MRERRWFANVSFPLFVVSGACGPEAEAQGVSAGSGAPGSGVSIFKSVSGRVPGANSGEVGETQPEIGSVGGFFSNNKALRRQQAASKYEAHEQDGAGANSGKTETAENADEQIAWIGQMIVLGTYMDQASKAHKEQRWGDELKYANEILALKSECVADKQPFGYVYKADAEFMMGDYRKALGDCEQALARAGRMSAEDRAKLKELMEYLRGQCREKLGWE